MNIQIDHYIGMVGDVNDNRWWQSVSMTTFGLSICGAGPVKPPVL